MRGELAAAGFDGAEIVELFLETVGVAAGELFIPARLGFCFAWGDVSLDAGQGGRGGRCLFLWPLPFRLYAGLAPD